MDRDLLAHLPIVLAVARHSGFAAAAAALGMSPSAVSHAVRVVEDRLGEPLFARTTRSMSTTEAGKRFLATIGPALDDIAGAYETLAADRGEISGHLRINVPRSSVEFAVTPLLIEAMRRHPRLVVEVVTEEAFVDIVARGFDAGIRLGEAVAEDMVTVRLTPPFQTILVAAPAYLAECGVPASLGDLPGHRLIGYRLAGSGEIYAWDLNDGGRDVKRALPAAVIVTDASYARDLAIAGIGIAYLQQPLVAAELAAGKLIQLLPETAVQEEGLFLYFPRRAAMAPKLRAFIDLARARPR
ncbi:MAG: LysR family transcriptional regulator [Ancalomicrobiaceae bacterium]|nr:LysR family transcriptional regulator [Ancalomicrobiaceae bacterium]